MPRAWTRVARRRRVAQLRAQGLAIRQIARLLEVAVSTVDRDLAALALRGGRVPPTARRDLAGSGHPEPEATVTGRDGKRCPADGADAIVLAGRLGDLAGAYVADVRRAHEAQLVDVRHQLTEERRRHTQEVAALKAQGERQRRELEGRLATQAARAEELFTRAVAAERRAETVVGRLAAVERLMPPAQRARLLTLLS
jgi:hypothetical protein